MSILLSTSAPERMAPEPTSLLNLIAGEFAPRVAALWPAPHAPFVTAPAARRHLVCVALALGRDLSDAGEALFAAAPKRALATAVPSGPPGLARALGRLGDIAWAAEDYRRLLALLMQPRPAKVLRHAEAIAPEAIRRLAALPAPMNGALRLAWELSDAATAVVVEVYEAIRFRAGRSAADAAAERWSRVETVKALMEAVAEEVSLELPPHPFAGTDRLRPLATKAALREAGKRFGNCLATRIPYAANGSCAYFEWVEAPGAIVEVTRCHVFGWRLDEARAPQNAPVPESLRGEIIADLALMGVHTGRSGWRIDNLVGRALSEGFVLEPPALAIAEAFGDDV